MPTYQIVAQTVYTVDAIDESAAFDALAEAGFQELAVYDTGKARVSIHKIPEETIGDPELYEEEEEED